MSVADLEEGYLWTQVNEPTTLAPEDGGIVEAMTAILPVWSGTYRNGFWREDTNDLYQGDYTGRGLNQGAAFYGAYLASVGSLQSMSVRMTRLVVAGAAQGILAPTMRLLEGTADPSTPYPNVLATAPGPAMGAGETALWGVPSAWLALMQSGAAGGLGIGVDTAAPYLAIAQELPLLANVYTAASGGLGLGPLGQTPLGVAA